MILVTGGTGLVGSHLLFKLVSNNTSVRAIYRRAHKLESVKKVFSYYTDDVDTFFNKIEWIEANINDVPSLEPAFIGVTNVYHCAAFISFEPNKYYEHHRKKSNKPTHNYTQDVQPTQSYQKHRPRPPTYHDHRRSAPSQRISTKNMQAHNVENARKKWIKTKKHN